ncbi:hypothetical protein N7532_008590 [Penicillium argentinense]|uniref:RTA1 domain protein n=1 Tax=Penicillium argentinense TaxID=1131581 RepID=A0A9W9EXX5_9EURO|nr:uncharacterized protein N7532_008590 [Penicillium argentinense]KAJ5089906.1 hypothetical protein N7532_008590 [Penicillium argentinense]
MAIDGKEKPHGYYLYEPSHILPAVFAALVAISLILHTLQNIRYRFWRITFFISWGGIIFTIGWILRCISSYYPDHLGLYIAQAVFIYLAPPVYSAAAYNIVGRLMNYLPMHAVLNPNRVLVFFVYLGAAVEGMTAAGAAKNAAAGDELDEYKKGGQLIAAGLILQAVVEMLVIMIVATVHRRAAKARKVSRNVQIVCFSLYGTSAFVVLRCIFRAIESFEMFDKLGCTENCGPILSNEWYLYAFELGPMLIFTYWLNLLHPGRYIPREKNRYLGTDARIERIGPGWRDRRDRWETFIDPLDLEGLFKGQASHEKYWENPERWPACQGSFAEGTASNVKNRGYSKEDVLLANEV